MADSPAATPRASLSPLTPMQRIAARMHQQWESPSTHGNGAHQSLGSAPSDASSPAPTNSPINSPLDLDNSDANNQMPGNDVALNAYLGPSLKRARKLSPQAGTELDIFLVASPMERKTHEYALALACHEKLGSLVAHLNYRVPPTLAVTVKDYAWVFMLSPTITSYRYMKTPTVILDAMRDLNVEDVPPKRETGRCSEVEKLIRKALTQCRCHIKDKVVGTFEAKPNVAIDIASLTSAIVSSTKVKATAALYMRVAFIVQRWVAKEWPEMCDDDDFWLKVDEQLRVREQVAQFKTPTKIQEACQTIYDADKEQYGLPDLINYPMVAAHLQDDYIIALNDTSMSLPQVTQVKQGKKRSRGTDGA